VIDGSALDQEQGIEARRVDRQNVGRAVTPAEEMLFDSLGGGVGGRFHFPYILYLFLVTKDIVGKQA
jgi:hypothetical protein